MSLEVRRAAAWAQFVRPIAVAALATSLTITAYVGTPVTVAGEVTKSAAGEPTRRQDIQRQLGQERYPLMASAITRQTVSRGRRWVPIWRDDFNGAAGTPPRSDYWRYDTGGWGWGNEELQYYAAQPRVAATDGRGNLALRARQESLGRTCWYGPCRYSSARLTTEGKVSITHGRVEARMRLPQGRGLWPAFWMLGSNIRTDGWPECGEIDIVELVGNEPDTVWSSVHGPGYVRAGLTQDKRLAPPSTYSDAFHTFAVEWSSTSIAFIVDKQVYHRVAKSAIGVGNEWVFDKPFHVLINLAVGGSWPGDPDSTTVFPATLLVDHVAMYRRAR